MSHMGRPPLPKNLQREFVSIGLRPDTLAALKVFMRRQGISTITEAVRTVVIQRMIAEGLIDPDAPTPKRKAR
jgi:predicted methyltransferase